MAVYSSSPCIEDSTPMPDCFAPPKGTVAVTTGCWFTQTDPASSRSATAAARSRSGDHTDAPSP